MKYTNRLILAASLLTAASAFADGHDPHSDPPSTPTAVLLDAPTADQRAVVDKLETWRHMFSMTGRGEVFDIDKYPQLFLPPDRGDEMLTYDQYVPDWASTQIDGVDGYRTVWNRDLNDSFPGWNIEKMDVLRIEANGDFAWSAINYWGTGQRDGETYRGGQHGTHVWHDVDPTDARDWRIVHEHLTAITVKGEVAKRYDGKPPAPTPPAREANRPGVTAALTVVHEMAQRPGNIAVDPDGRIFASVHLIQSPVVHVVELLPDGTQRAYPNARWATAPHADKPEGISAIIGIEADAEHTLWMLDNGNAAAGFPPKLIAWQTDTEQLYKQWTIDAGVENSFMQDMAIDRERRMAYIADMAPGSPAPGSDNDIPTRPAFVVLNLATGEAARRLEAHPLLLAEPDTDFNAGGQPILNPPRTPGGEPVHPMPGLNPITIDPQLEWVYFGAMRGTSIYRIKAEDLANFELTDDQLAARIERVGPKPVSDGINVDTAGNIYVTDLPNNAIGVLSPAPADAPENAEGEYRILVKDDDLLIWPDGISYGPDGFYYTNVNQLHRHPGLNAGVDASAPPYRIVKFKPLAPSALGR
ncbi:MAG: L-dopachrome tautomerase-related protein [Planctomycetota bacterium]